MKSKRNVTIVLGLVLAVMVGLAVWDEKKTASEEAAEKTKNRLVTLDPKTVESLTYQFRSSREPPSGETAPHEDITVALEKVGDSWAIKSPMDAAADASTVEALLEKISTMAYDRKMPDDKASWESYGLEPPLIEIALKLSGGDELTVAVGDKAPVGYSTYVKSSRSDAVYLASQSIRLALGKSLFDFRRKTFVDLDRDQLRSLTYHLGKDKQHLTFENKDGQWVFAGGETGWELDETAFRSFVDGLEGLRAVAFHDSPDSATKEALKGEPSATISWTTVEGASESMRVFDRTAKIYVTLSTRPTVFEIGVEAKTKVIRELSDFRDRRIAKWNSGDVSSITIDGKDHEKVGMEWYAGEEIQKAKDGAQAIADHVVFPLLSSLEVARATELLPLNGALAKELGGQAPDHTLRFAFREELKREPVEMQVWAKKGEPHRVYVKTSQGKHLFQAADTLLDALKDNGEHPDMPMAPMSDMPLDDHALEEDAG